MDMPAFQLPDGSNSRCCQLLAAEPVALGICSEDFAVPVSRVPASAPVLGTAPVRVVLRNESFSGNPPDLPPWMEPGGAFFPSCDGQGVACLSANVTSDNWDVCASPGRGSVSDSLWAVPHPKLSPTASLGSGGQSRILALPAGSSTPSVEGELQSAA